MPNLSQNAAHLQEGHAIPGEVLFGTDSHTCNAGAFGMFATGIGNTDAGFILGTGKLLIKVPPTLRFNLVGEMPKYLLAKDLILQIIGEIGVRAPRKCAIVWGTGALDSSCRSLAKSGCVPLTMRGSFDGRVPLPLLPALRSKHTHGSSAATFRAGCAASLL